MSRTLTIRDESPGAPAYEFDLNDLAERITVEELIRSRVYQEVQDFNLQQRTQSGKAFRGLVQPTDAEVLLNGTRPRRQVNWKEQFELALDAFHRNQILVLVNDRQVDSLTDEIDVGPDTRVSFLRLTMLVGG